MKCFVFRHKWKVVFKKYMKVNSFFQQSMDQILVLLQCARCRKRYAFRETPPGDKFRYSVLHLEKIMEEENEGRGNAKGN